MAQVAMSKKTYWCVTGEWGSIPTTDHVSSECTQIKLLGDPWDLVTTYNWAYNPTYNPSKWASRGYPNSK